MWYSMENYYLCCKYSLGCENIGWNPFNNHNGSNNMLSWFPIHKKLQNVNGWQAFTTQATCQCTYNNCIQHYQYSLYIPWCLHWHVSGHDIPIIFAHDYLTGKICGPVWIRPMLESGEWDSGKYPWSCKNNCDGGSHMVRWVSG